MFTRVFSKQKVVNGVIVMLLAAVMVLSGVGNKAVAASSQPQQKCGGTLTYGQYLDQQNFGTQPSCYYYVYGKEGERITIQVDTLGNRNLDLEILLRESNGTIIASTDPNDSLVSNVLTLKNIRLNRGDGWYGFQITFAFPNKPETKVGSFRVSVISETINLINLRSGKSDKCLYPDTYPPNEVGQWTCDGGTNQWWYAEPIGSTHLYRIHSSGNQTYAYCLDVAKGSKNTYEQVVGNWCNPNSLSQQWRLGKLINGKRELINVNSGLCLDLRNGSQENGAIIQQYPCVSTAKNPENNQLWNFVESFGSVVLYDGNDCKGSPVGNAKGYGLYNFTDGIQQKENGLKNDKAASMRVRINNDNKGPVWIGIYDNTNPQRNRGAGYINKYEPHPNAKYPERKDYVEYCTNLAPGNVRGKVSWMEIRETLNELSYR